MKRDEAITLIKEYAAILAEDEEDCDEYSLEAERVLDMASRVDNPGHSEKKCMRWLGFVQGVLWAKDYYALEELKEHSRVKRVTSVPW